MELESIIIKNLLSQDEYSKKVLPYLKPEYFQTDETKRIFTEIAELTLKYSKLPEIETVETEIDFMANLAEGQDVAMKAILKEIKDDTTVSDQKWLIDRTEEFCKERALHNAVWQSICIMDGKDKKRDKGAIPGLLTDALAISFDPNVGHDYFEDMANRYDYMHQVLNRVPFDIEYLNKITNGGLPNKTLSVILAGVNVGKSLLMCHMAANNLAQGKNVLYITLELAEEEVSKRIDANLMNVELDDLKALSKEDYLKRGDKLKAKTNGKLIIKEYPTAGASVIHFEALLNELLLKKNFKPDIIYVDYIGIMQSSRIKMGADSYGYVKSVAEELRGFAVKHILPIVTAVQVNRAGFNNSDFDMTNTAESFGLPATADFMIALISTPEMEELNQFLVKQLKSRLGDKTKDKRFVIGVDRGKMRVYDTEESAQKDIVDSGRTAVSTVQNKKDKFKGINVT